LAAHQILPSLAAFPFEAYFRRALILGAILFLWPLLRWLQIRGPQDLDLSPNPAWVRDVSIGFFIAALPTLFCGIVLIVSGNYSLRSDLAWSALVGVSVRVAVVPFIEEPFFRGLLLGVILRSCSERIALVLTSGIFAIVHFLKPPTGTVTSVGWGSGLGCLIHSFDQFTDPMLVGAGFLTLFIIGAILAYARLRTKSLWLPIGLHGGWIFASTIFSRIAHRGTIVLPWLGKNLLIGVVPLGVCLATWFLVGAFLKYAGSRQS
jgi:membrane protease YdiL (CAAX protease family)